VFERTSHSIIRITALGTVRVVVLYVFLVVFWVVSWESNWNRDLHALPLDRAYLFIHALAGLAHMAGKRVRLDEGFHAESACKLVDGGHGLGLWKEPEIKNKMGKLDMKASGGLWRARANNFCVSKAR
jgi:hypothetical protein